MPSITITDLQNAKKDVDHIGAIATSTAGTATDRLGTVKNTIAGSLALIAADVAAVDASRIAGEAAINGKVAGIEAQTAAVVAANLAVIAASGAVATTQAGIATTAKIDAQTAKSAAETAQTLAQAASAASAISLAAKDTIALGRASVADGATFWVRPNSTDGLVRYTNYLRVSSATQTFVNSAATGTEQETIFERQKLKADLQVGRNFFNPADADVIPGFYVLQSDGVLTANATFTASGFIAVVAGGSYAQSYAIGAFSGWQYAWFSAAKAYISGGLATAAAVAPAGAAFLRASISTAQIGTFLIELGATPGRYVAYAPTLPPAQLRDGGLTEAKHGQASIGYRHTKFLQPGKNIFNALDPDVALGFYVDGALGVLTANASYNTTGFIPVVAGASYRLSYGNQLAWYDASKNFVSGVTGIGGVAATQAAPAAAVYLRCMMPLANWAAFQVEAGTVSTAYETFKLALSGPGGVPILAQVADGAITLAKAAFFQPGKNKFNKDTAALGVYIDEAGNQYSNAGYDVSDFIAVTPGTVFYAPRTRFTCYYNAAKALVAGGVSTFSDAFTIPAGVASMRASIEHSALAAYQVEVAAAPTAYESFGYIVQQPGGYPIRFDPAAMPLAETDFLAMAAKQYIAYGKEIAIYHENIAKDYPAYKGRTGIVFAGGKETGSSTKITPVIGQSGATLAGTATAADAAFAAVASRAFSVVVTDAARTAAANLQNIGDSYGAGMNWSAVINASAAATGLTFSGNRTSSGTTPSVRCEGQGGWSLNSYFTVDYLSFLSPFMQPVTAGYLYYGQTGFWIDANSATPSYNAGSFTTTKDAFSASTGRKLAPNVNDVMGDAGSYIRWSGSAWVAIVSATFGGFAFSYGKYRAAWAIPAPTIMHVLLGTNDFAATTAATFPAAYAAYKLKYDALIASVKADTPAVKIIVGIPVSPGRQGKHGTLDTERRKRGFYLLARQLNADFGGREAESIYVLDYHSVVDRYYGYTNTYEKPFSDFTGAATEDYFKADTVHLGVDGWKQMGNAYMGLIQFLR